MTIRIKTKIILSFVTVTVLLSFLGLLAYHNRNVLFDTLVDVRDEIEELEAITDLKLAMDMAVMPPNDYLITGSAEERPLFAEAVRKVDAMFVEAEELALHSPESATLFRGAKEEFTELEVKAEKIFALEDPVGNPRGAELMLELDTLANDIIVNHLDSLYLLEKEEISGQLARADNVMTRVDRALIIGVVVSALTILAVAFYLFRSIIRPIMSFTEGARIIRRGDLGHRIDIQDGLEINVLADEFNQMAERLRESHAGLERKVEERTHEFNEINEKLKELSITDGLTGVYNQRHFYDRLDMELKRAERYSRPMAVVMADIDHFKIYNDNNGHLEGDKVLAEVASILMANIREPDTVARYGGEEFAVIMPETDKTSAENAAERIRIAIESHHFPYEECQPGGTLTMSLGVAVFPVDASDARPLIKTADDALYRAKDGGRNQVKT